MRKSAMITECQTPQNNHRDICFSIYYVVSFVVVEDMVIKIIIRVMIITFHFYMWLQYNKNYYYISQQNLQLYYFST